MIRIKKIFHRGEYRIAIYCPQKASLNKKLLFIGALFSKTYQCWYIDYNKEKYNQLQSTFDSIEIIPDTVPDVNLTQLPLRKPTDVQPCPPPASLHTVNEQPDKGKSSPELPINITLKKDVGKYWVLHVPFSEKITKGLLGIKGVYWSKKDTAFFIFRHITVKTKVEALLGMSDLLPSNFYRSDEDDNFSTGEMIATIFPTDRRCIKLIVPPVSQLIQQIKRWQSVRYSKSDAAYILPATPDMVLNLVTIGEQTGIRLINHLPPGYARKEYAPNLKMIKLGNVVANLEKQIPAQVQTVVYAMMDYLLAKNYSASTLRTYTEAFLLFLKHHQFKDPNILTQREIVTYLAQMMKNGLSASTAHTLINSLLFYYRNVLQRESFEIVIPRPKNEKKLPSVLTMTECYSIFNAIDNPKHKLLLLLGYGAGLRLSEIVELKWGDILLPEFKIHIKAAKGKKDRIVMLPYSIVSYLESYRQLYKGTDWVFEGQYKGEPYSSRTVQLIMQSAIVKAGLDKTATVHTLRHSFATHLLEAGVDIRYIQGLLGHTSINTTTIYTHLTNKAVNKVQSPLDNLMNKINHNRKLDE